MVYLALTAGSTGDTVGTMTTTHQPFTLDDYRLAFSHGDYSYNPRTETPEQGRVRCAIRTARLMAAMRDDADVFVDWVASDLEWDGCEPYDGPLYDAVLYVGDEVVTSCGCIAVPDTSDGYCRVIEADLYCVLERMREANTIRSLN